MIWHEEVEFIAMLCNFIEMNKPKVRVPSDSTHWSLIFECDKYFPMDEGEILSTQDFSIQCMAVRDPFLFQLIFDLFRCMVINGQRLWPFVS